jgi:hypothetical protein
MNRILGGANNHTLALLQSPSASQASSLPASMALSPTPSVGLSDAQTGPASPSTAISKHKDLEIESASKTTTEVQDEEEIEDEDVDHLSLTQKAPSSSTKQSTSKSYKKR